MGWHWHGSSFYIIKITSLSFENPLGIRADGTISIPKEVILAGASGLLHRPRARRLVLSALDYCLVAAFAAGSILGYLDSQLFMKITNQFLPAGFVGDSHSFCAPQATQKCLWVYCSALAAKPKVLIPQDIRYSPINITTISFYSHAG